MDLERTLILVRMGHAHVIQESVSLREEVIARDSSTTRFFAPLEVPDVRNLRGLHWLLRSVTARDHDCGSFRRTIGFQTGRTARTKVGRAGMSTPRTSGVRDEHAPYRCGFRPIVIA